MFSPHVYPIEYMYESQEGRQTCNISTLSTFPSWFRGVTETFPHDLIRQTWNICRHCRLFSVGRKQKQIAWIRQKWKGRHLAFLQNVDLSVVVAGVGLEPHDLRVMSPTSYQLLHPAISAFQPLYGITLRRICQGRMGSNRENLKVFGYFSQFDWKTNWHYSVLW